jgi:hypothetical protein
MEGPETRAEGVENEISLASQTVAIRSTRDGKVDN